METKTLIQAQVNVVKITALKKGDVVKLIEKTYSDNEIYYAVVIDMLNTGKESYLQLLRYKQSYGDITAEIVTFDGEKDLAILPATIKEVAEHFERAIDSMKVKIKVAKETLQKDINAMKKLEHFSTGELSKKLTEASFEEITQKVYNKRLEQLQ